MPFILFANVMSLEIIITSFAFRFLSLHISHFATISSSTLKNKSDVWVNFEKFQSGKARYKLCSKELVSVGGSTSGMNVHLRAMYPDVGKIESPQPKLPSFIVGAHRQRPECRQETLTNMLLDIMTENFLPMTFIKLSSVLGVPEVCQIRLQDTVPSDGRLTVFCRRTPWLRGSRRT